MLNVVLTPILVTLLVGTFVWYTRYVLPWNEKRKDLVRLSDRFLKFFPTFNTWAPVNLLDHGCKIYYILHIVYWQTVEFDLAALTWILMINTRCLMIFLCPLKVLPHAAPLHDPVQRLALVNIQPFVHDLFFSGHVSACVTMGLTASVHPEYFFASAAAITVLMFFSKVHYTIDLMVAPYVAWGSYCMAQAAIPVLSRFL